MYKAILFDLDGTLLNTLDDLNESMNKVLVKNGYKEQTKDETRRFVGNGVRKLVERSLPGESVEFYDRIESEFKECYAKNMRNKTAPYEGIQELLKALKERQVKVGVVSNKFDGAVKSLCKEIFGEYTQVAVGEKAGVRKKPAPDSVLAAIDELGVKKEETIYAGDSDVDIETAKNAGIKSIGVTWGFRDRELLISCGADFLADKAEDILKIVCG